MEIKLSNRGSVLIDDADWPLVSKHTWWLNSGGYAYTTVNRKNILMHRLILNPGEGVMTDHINRDRLDNRRSNLRTGNRSQNAANLLRQNKSGFKGVVVVASKRPGGPLRYRADVYKGSKRHCGPRRIEVELAARDYDALAREVHGEYAFQNFPVQP